MVAKLWRLRCDGLAEKNSRAIKPAGHFSERAVAEFINFICEAAKCEPRKSNLLLSFYSTPYENPDRPARDQRRRAMFFQ